MTQRARTREPSGAAHKRHSSFPITYGRLPVARIAARTAARAPAAAGLGADAQGVTHGKRGSCVAQSRRGVHRRRGGAARVWASRVAGTRV